MVSGGHWCRGSSGSNWQPTVCFRAPPSPHLTLPPKPQKPTTFLYSREGQEGGLEHQLRSEKRKGCHTHHAWESGEPALELNK